ncbi:MAG: radical SAM protein, partial [Betaproteobacteria bacterium]|nr:radical SAM protein [Betaproteobacteria bacterium]
MSEKSIRLIDERYLARAMPAPVAGRPPGANIADRFGRRLHDLRISVTDRCNFRCAYCMPKSVFDRDYAFLPQSAMLNFEEIYRLASIFVGLGTDKLRITGGEPLLRKHLERLIAMLAQLRTPTGQSPDLTLTTNGALLRKKAAALREAGLRRLTVSAEVIAQIQQSHPLHPLDPNYAGEVARRWALDDGSLELGLIASVTEPFCHGCTR